MSNDLILHPTEAFPVPVTICPPKRARKPRARKGEGMAACTVAELRVVLKSRNMKFTTKHTKAELLAMAISGQYVVAAAQVRENERRKAKRAAA